MPPNWSPATYACGLCRARIQWWRLQYVRDCMWRSFRRKANWFAPAGTRLRIRLDMMRFVQLFLAAILVASGAAQVWAAARPVASTEAVAAPQWRVGSTWEYSDGYRLRVASVANGTTTFERLDAAGQWFSMRGFLRQDAASSTAK